MRPPRTLIGPAFAAVLLLTALSGCGDETRLPQVPSSTPFTTGSVSISQQGSAPVTIDTSSVTFMPDDSGSLVAHVTLTSTAVAPVTVIVRGSLYDPSHAIVGDLTGGQVNVAAGSTTTIQLNGPRPLGTIASATFEVTTQPSPT
jgi:hypothetical protein